MRVECRASLTSFMATWGMLILMLIAPNRNVNAGTSRGSPTPGAATTAIDDIGQTEGTSKAVLSPASPASPAPKVLLIGDSMMRAGVAGALKRLLSKNLGAEVTQKSKAATGLARPEVYDWSAAIKDLVKGRHFQHGVVFIGANDCQSLTGGAEPVQYGSKEWEPTYRSRVREILGQLCAAVDDVWWLELPPMRMAKFNARISVLNKAVAAEVAQTKCGHFLPLAQDFADGKGRYLASKKTGGRRLVLRDKDGIHLSAAGSEMVADLVVKAISEGRSELDEEDDDVASQTGP